MNTLSTKGWQDYELIDSGNSKRLERYGKFTLIRPDPQAIWKPQKDNWRADTEFVEGKGWTKKLQENWILTYKKIKLKAKETNFKHTGIFPEQVLNWNFIEEKLADLNYQTNILNLFGYTGAASLICAQLGARVTHLDGSKPSIAWAKENQSFSGLLDKPIRWILDDAIEFTAREGRRGNIYDGVIMDPPAYGHGPKGQIWDFNRSFPELLSNIKKILKPDPSFVIINAYAISASSEMLKNTMEDYLGLKGKQIEHGELAIEEKNRKRLLSTGIFARV